MNKILLALLFLLSNTAFNNQSYAKDYGIHGTTYQISEKNLLAEIQEKLLQAQNNGKLAKFQNNIKKQMISAANNPKGQDNIIKATISREWYFDPSISRSEDLADQNGKVFYRAGTKVNPLDYISMSQKLIFIDGDDNSQVKWALKQGNKAKIILVRGHIIDLMKQNKTRLYFDQGGNLTKKFSIRAVPATVAQEGKMLKVKEVAI